MVMQSFQRSIRFSKSEWDAVIKAAEKADMTPAAFVRNAAARAAAEGIRLDEGHLTPELIDLFKRTFRGVHVLAYLKHGELEQLDRLEDFENAVEDARSAQDETLRMDDDSPDR